MSIVHRRLEIKRSIATKFPLVWRYARALKWRSAYSIRRVLIQHGRQTSELHVDPNNVYWISPFTIKHAIYGSADLPKPATVSGMVKSGDWDKRVLPVEDLDIVKGAKDRFTNGMDWEETEYYRNHLDRILTGEQWNECNSKQSLDEYCRRFDCLCDEIKSSDNKQQGAIPETKYCNPELIGNEIAVHIDRDGRFLLCDGWHRLAIARALGIGAIPIKVSIRHAKWQAFCNEILAYGKKDKVYQPLTHPDLQSIPSFYSQDRFEIISKHLPESKGDLLDIGANLGFFCHRFEELGFCCYAVEANPENAYFLDKLKTAQDRQFKIIGQSIFTYRERNSFDVVLALNIFHHFLKTKADYDALIQFLGRMNMKMMIFESHHTWESQMKNAYRNYEPDEFVSFILKHSCLNRSSLIGTADDERSIYKLWK
jgi:hypothetical protein